LTPTRTITDSIAALIAANSTGLGEAVVKNVTLVIANFTPGPDLAFADLTVATFDGATPLVSPSGAQLAFTDAITGLRVIQMKDPAGGFHWVTTGVTNLPQTVYGFVVTNDDDTITFGAEKFPAPIVLTGTGQGVDIGVIRFTQAANALS